ncbi:Cysteine synthase [Dirofilaria immitis]
MHYDIYAAIIPIDPTMLACVMIIVAVALMIELITLIYKLRIIISKERKRKLTEIPLLLSDLNNPGKNTVHHRTIKPSIWESDNDDKNNLSKNSLLPVINMNDEMNKFDQ